jgi:formate/nitrite transporter FocA (FNT family)
MTHARQNWYRVLFWTAAIYDLVLGLVFLVFYRPVFAWLGVENELPRQTSYISLIAAFLFVIGVAYVLLAVGDLYRNRDLITIGILYKVAYFSVALWYLLSGLYPHLVFFVVFGVADALFAVAMTECRLFIRRTEPSTVGGVKPQQTVVTL